MPRMLETEQAARRLGVKVNTLYAYVSRGLLTSYPSPDTRRSLFDLDEVESLAKRSRSGKRVETRLAQITTGVTQLNDTGPSYRGRPAAELAKTETFETVAELLWEGDNSPWSDTDVGDVPAIPDSDLLRWATLMCGAKDPLRSDLRPATVVKNARTVISSAVSSLGAARGANSDASSIAQRLTAFLAGSEDPALIRAFDTALVVLADHELATSTMAVRVAASTRSDIYDALLAGLATMSGPLHGGASEAAHALILQSESVGPGRALDGTLRWNRVIPGFGHTVYTAGDPRADVLMMRFLDLATPEQRSLIASLIELAEAQSMPRPNIDLMLAAIAWAAELPADTGRTLFSVGRMAGFTAHYLEELNERPLRFRARAVYAQGRTN